MDTTVFCQKDVYHYFEDYLNSLMFQTVFELDPSINTFVQSIPKGVKVTKDTWLINTEQATRPDILEILGDVTNIYDYSEENIYILKTLKPDCNFKLLPYKRNPSEILNIPKTNWIAMVGNNSPRRNVIQDRLWGVNNIVGWGLSRDRELFKHKILINVHYHSDYAITEQIRINRCIHNKMIVISETSKHQELIALKDKIIFCDYDDIVKTVTHVMKNYDEIFAVKYG